MTEANTTRFNAEAAAWDSNPDVHLASSNALTALLATYPSLSSSPSSPDVEVSKKTVIELGCGTGLLTLLLSPHVDSILAIDASSGMIDALSLKLDATGAPRNVYPLCILLEDPEDPRLPAAIPDPSSPTSPAGGGFGTLMTHRRKFDLAVSHLTLHHIPDMAAFLTTLLGCLVPHTGEVFLTDFENFGPEARRFHPESKMEGVERHGILQGEIREVMEGVGFVDVEVKVGWRQEKEVEMVGGGREGMVFPFLTMRGRRP